MKAHEIRPGDVLHDRHGNLLYTVQEVSQEAPDMVVARVQFVDGGIEPRRWHTADLVPLTRPDKEIA